MCSIYNFSKSSTNSILKKIVHCDLYVRPVVKGLRVSRYQINFACLHEKLSMQLILCNCKWKKNYYQTFCSFKISHLILTDNHLPRIIKILTIFIIFRANTFFTFIKRLKEIVAYGETLILRKQYVFLTFFLMDFKK